jgi:hypothetical protein
VGSGLADGLAEGLALTLAELLDETAGVGEVVRAGENEGEGDPAEGVDPVQAESAAETRMVMAPQPMMVKIALSPVPAMVVRTFMEPPHASRQVAAPFPVPAPDTDIGRNMRGGPAAARAGRRQVPERADGHKGETHGRHRLAMT